MIHQAQDLARAFLVSALIVNMLLHLKARRSRPMTATARRGIKVTPRRIVS